MKPNSTHPNVAQPRQDHKFDFLECPSNKNQKEIIHYTKCIESSLIHWIIDVQVEIRFTKQQQFRHLPLVSQSIEQRRTRHTGNC